MLVNNKNSFLFQPSSTFTNGISIDFNPEDLEKSKYSYLFVPPTGNENIIITDYVPKSTGGSFDGLVSYTSQLTITDPKHLTTKKYVDDAITAGVNDTIDWTLAREQVSSSTGTPLTYASETGVFTLNKALSNYINDAGFKTSVTQTDVTAQQSYIRITSSQITDFDTAVGSTVTTNFNTLFDSRFITKSIVDLGTKNHSSLTGIAGSSDGYHLSSSQFLTATQSATTERDGYLSLIDWNIFNNKLNTLTAGNGIDFNGELISVNKSQIINDTGTTALDIWSAEKIISYTTAGLTTYTIRLNAGTSLAQRTTGLVEGTDYPTGWTISFNGASLIITHNLNLICTYISVLSINGTTNSAVKLEGNVAFSTFTNNYYLVGYNRITLDTFNVDGTELYIKIIV